jgi:hypothetical protein
VGAAIVLELVLPLSRRVWPSSLPSRAVAEDVPERRVGTPEERERENNKQILSRRKKK